MPANLNTVGADKVTNSGNRVDPLRGYRFLVSNERNITHAGFSKVEGLEGTAEVIEYREGINGQTNRKLPGRVTWADVTFNRGILLNVDDIFDWAKVVLNIRDDVLDEQKFRQDTTIKLFPRTGKTFAVEWRLNESWVTSYKVSAMDAMTSDIVMQEVVVAHEGLEEGTAAKPLTANGSDR